MKKFLLLLLVINFMHVPNINAGKQNLLDYWAFSPTLEYVNKAIDCRTSTKDKGLYYLATIPALVGDVALIIPKLIGTPFALFLKDY